MISIVICSTDRRKEQQIRSHYRTLLGDEPYELLVFNDASSLAEAYNRGIDRSSGEILIFSHDDIEFLQPRPWFSRLKKHLLNFDLIGLAGTDRLISAGWAQAGPPHTFGHVAELDGGQIGPFRVLIFSTPSVAIPNIQAMDGLFLAVHRRVVEKVRFDEVVFDGFHCYDTDFTFQAFQNKFRSAVITDMPVLHASQGHFDDKWRLYAQKFVAKHRAQLSKMQPRPYQHAVVGARSKAELLDIMTPSWLNQS